MSRSIRQERTTLDRLEDLTRHTEQIGKMLRHLWPLIAVVVFLVRM